MPIFQLIAAKFSSVLPIVCFVFCSGMSQVISAQAFENGDFENGSVGWSGCSYEIGTADTYGGSGSTMVAEVDGDLTTSPTDDRMLCQTISGFLIGGTYRLEFEATRREDSSTPNTISASMYMDNDALYRTVTRSGGYAMVTESFDFNATATTHEFQVLPNFEGSFGIVFDNFRLTPLYYLPIELLSFTAEASGDGVQLNWVTATEQDNSLFTVQRSVNGSEFSDVGEVAGAGNSLVQLAYAVVDRSPITGLAYYRLKQTDIQGDETVFTSVPVYFQRSHLQDLEVFPNPSSNGQLWLTANGLVEEVTVPISITDVQGRLIHGESITLTPDIAVDLSRYVALEEGMYLVSIATSGKPQSIRLVVQ